MKKLLLLLLSLGLLYPVIAQDNGISYQAVILTGKKYPTSNETIPFSDQEVCLKFVFKTSANASEYEEIITTRTDEFGMVNVVIGTGERVGGTAASFGQILWTAETKFMDVLLDKQGLCTAFELLSSQQFTAVPFALFAKTAGTPGTPGPQGATGAVGPQGPRGLTGPAGAKGATGQAGQTGNRGATGATGPQGATGISNPLADCSEKIEVGEQVYELKQRVSLFASALTHQIRFEIAPGQLVVCSEDLEAGGEGRETLDVEYEGEPTDTENKILVKTLQQWCNLNQLKRLYA